MGKHDWNVLLYLMLVTSVLMCLVMAYSVFFLGPLAVSVSPKQLLSPVVMIVLSAILASTNSFAASLISEFALRKIDKVPGKSKYLIVVAIFILTFLGSLVLAIIAAD